MIDWVGFVDDPPEKSCIIMEEEFFPAMPGSIVDTQDWFLARLPMENDCHFFFLVDKQAGKGTARLCKGTGWHTVFSLYPSCDITKGQIVPLKEGTGWQETIECANDLRALLMQIGRLPVAISA